MKYFYKLIHFCEIDKKAAEVFCKLHNVSILKNLWDITTIKLSLLSYINFLVGGSPCQDFSIAGKCQGSKYRCKSCNAEYNPLTVHYTRRHLCPECGSKRLERTRSSLLVYWLKLLHGTKPKVAFFENVKNLLSKNFKDVFDLFVKEIEEYGYNVYYKVLNAKDYGIPQNRERVFLIAIRKDCDNGLFKFWEPLIDRKTFEDILDPCAHVFENTDDRIVIDDKIMPYVKRNIERDKELIVNTDKNILRLEAKSGFQDNVVGINYAPALTASNHSTIVLQKTQIGQEERYYIKKLSASESLRMMGFTKEDYEAASEVASDSQIYKQAGNSIVVDPLYYTLKALFNAMPYLFEDVRLLSTFSGIGSFERSIKKVIDEANALAVEGGGLLE